MIPKISVIMPFYNCEKFLDESIGSILNQTLKDFELIIINDASTDNSDQVVKKYLHDKRIVYIKNKTNKQVVKNLNKGIEIARADLVARFDGDDVCEITRLEKQYNFLQENPEIDLLGSFIKFIDENGEEIFEVKKPTSPKGVARSLFSYSTFVAPSTIAHKSVIQEIGGFRETHNVIFGSDIDLYYRIIFAGYKGANIPEFLVKSRIHENSSIKKNLNKKMAIKNYKMRKEVIKNYNYKPNLKERAVLYGQFVTEYFLTTMQKRRLEAFLKKTLLR